ncbi:Calcium and integrin-binding family member 4 [Armadillidium vulgare]|nr:Calcium and integrin-binding family member 4 [Armadillidium vulgare]
MMSAFSDAAPKSVKAEYAFRIFDFDGDDYLGREDLVKTIERLIHPQRFKEDDLNVLINRIYEEADLDDDGMLAFAEFEHVISKSPDFSNSFRIRLNYWNLQHKQTLKENLFKKETIY